MVWMALLSPAVYAMRAATSVKLVQTTASMFLSKGRCHLHVVFSVWFVLLVLVGGDTWMVAGEAWLYCEVAVSFGLSVILRVWWNGRLL